MNVYLIPIPATKLSRRGRAEAWSYVKPDRNSLDRLNDIVKQLMPLSPKTIFAADLHERIAVYLSERLNARKRTLHRLRPFNVGRHVGRHLEEVDEVLLKMFKQWKENATIPITGGDSWISYQRRFLRAIEELMKDETEDCALVLPAREISLLKAQAQHKDPQEMLLSKNWADINHVYVIRTPDKHAETSPVESSPERRSALVANA